MKPQIIGSIWDNITHDYTLVERMKPFSGAKVYGNRAWEFVNTPDSNKIFYATNKKLAGQLMEKVIFDKSDKLQSITLYSPDMLTAIGGVKLANDFSEGNEEINTFRTKYTYSKDRKKDRLLSAMQHTSTYFKRNVTYYKLEFSVTLADSLPQEQCNIPIDDMSATEYSINQHGYGVWELLKKKGISE